jgi:dipeptidyl aminopeptidase/acylaminoacyl peptidase
MTIGAAVAFAHENERRFIEESKSLLRMPSISADPKHVCHVRRAEFVAEELKPIGMKNGRLIVTTRSMSKLGYVLNSFLHPTVLLVTALLPASVRAQTTSDPHMVSPPHQTFSAIEAAVETQLALLGQTARTPSRVALSPDGARLAWSLPSGGGTVLHVSEVADSKHDITVAPGSASGGCSSNAPVWSPDGGTLAFSAVCNRPGDTSGGFPQAQIYLWSRKTGGVRQLTHLTGGLSNLAWSFDSKSLIFLFIENATRDPGYGDAAKPLAGVIDQDGLEVSRIYQADAATGQGAFVTPATLHVYEFGLASGSRTIVFLAAPPPGEESWPLSLLYTVEAPEGSAAVVPAQPHVLVDPRNIAGSLHGIQMAIPRLSPDGKRVAFLCGLMTDPMIYGGDLCVADVHLSVGGVTPVDATPGLKATVQYEQWLANDTVNFVENRNGHTVLVNWNVDTHQPEPNGILDLGEVTVYGGGPQGPAGPAVADISYAPARRTIAFGMQGHSTPPEVYTVRNGTLTQFTHLNDGAQPPTHTISVEWENEGFHVQGWLSFPANYDPKKTYPLLVQAHGGPEWSIGSRWDGDTWRGISPFWPGMGYFLFLPNPRGSYGQGEAFTLANRRHWIWRLAGHPERGGYDRG